MSSLFVFISVAATSQVGRSVILAPDDSALSCYGPRMGDHNDYDDDRGGGYLVVSP